MPFICIDPSPTKEITGRSGWANFEPMPYGTELPIVASVPDSVARTPDGNLRSRAYQFAADPESAVRIAFLGSRSFSSQKSRIGLIGSASTIASRSTDFHH